MMGSGVRIPLAAPLFKFCVVVFSMILSSRRRMSRSLIACAVLSVSSLLTGCAQPEVFQRGYLLEDDTPSKVKVGMDVNAVLQAIGTPSTVSTVGNRTFYYISQRAERRWQFAGDTVVDQRVLVVVFNKSFRVERIALYGLQDGKPFDFISRTTSAGGVEQSFINQVFKGLGTFNPLQ
jgi:outer membrane protein assembly factor BamE (lipoprotein component of BamABCDE complex)